MTLVDKILVLVLALGVWTGIALYAVSIEPARAEHINANEITGLDEWIMMTVEEYCLVDVDEEGDHWIICY
jgi:hypothetical protein